MKTFRKDYTRNSGPETIVATVRHDDRCGNGHNTFSITGDVYIRDRHYGEPTVKHESGATLWLSASGCIHDEIAEHFPELIPLLKYHLCSTDGPIHYVANTMYLAGRRDCNGLREGETRQIRNGKTGQLSWILTPDRELPKHVDADECPTETVTMQYVPWNQTGEGKPRDLDAARRCAVWPEATDEELTAPGLEQRLRDRLPALMIDFRAVIESLNFNY